MKLTLEQKQAVGLDKSQLVEFQQGDKCLLLHAGMIESFKLLKNDAAQAGFDLCIVSGHRDFYRQLAIWNAKASGKRDLLDSLGQLLNYELLNDEEKMFAILRWSALPGLSRHHWGTDFDIYDANQMSFDEVKLIPQEVEGNGPCAAMHKWLSDRITNNESHFFYRPYQKDLGGVAPEFWHLSYLPLSKCYFHALKIEKMLELWSENELLLLKQVEANVLNIWKFYVVLNDTSQPEWVTKFRL